MLGEPAAFMSYVRFNDQHDDGQLSQFQERLAAEVRAQTGEEFPIFQDRNDIAWGQNWQQRIDEALDAVTLLVVIITPSLFRSPACRDEFQKFLDREGALGRGDLILPVYYISTREMDDPGLREADEMARELASRQFADWRELRFEPFTSPQVRKTVAQLASRMRDTFWQPPAVSTGRLARPAQGPKSPVEPGDQGGTGRITAKTEPPTHIVDAYQRGDFATVSAAIKAAKPGDRILVRPGLYLEGLVVDKPLEILGDGSLSDITQGRLDLEGCDISSQSFACVVIRDGADPRLRRNKIHDGKQGGVLVVDSGLSTLEDNDITGNAHSGVEVTTGGNPTVRGNRINRNGYTAVYVHDGGRGAVENNDLTGNEQGAWDIAEDCKANMTRARNKE